MQGLYDPLSRHLKANPSLNLTPQIRSPVIGQELAPNSTPNPELQKSQSISYYCQLIDEQAKTISKLDLKNSLDKILHAIKQSHGERKINYLIDITHALMRVNASVLASTAQHQFFNVLQAPFIEVMEQWLQNFNLDNNQLFIYKHVTKLLKKLFKETGTDKLHPSWLFASSFLCVVNNCLSDLSKPKNFFFEKSSKESKCFVRLFNMLSMIQERLNQNNSTNKDKLAQLLDSVAECITSTHYIDAFETMSVEQRKLGKKAKFFLLRCPAFIIAYNGTRVQSIMSLLLSEILPKYITLFNDIIPQINQWNTPIFECVTYALQLVNHGSSNAKTLANHLPFIDHLITFTNTLEIIKNIKSASSNLETTLLALVVNTLANAITEPTILGHIKQKKVTSSFLRLTSAKYQPIRHDIHTILAYTTTEEDIKSMPEPGVLLSTVLKSLKRLTKDKAANHHEIEQLLETLKGLVQHDQMKDEVLKQNALQFLLSLTNDFAENRLKLLLEILWSLSFSADAAKVLRENTQLQNKVESMSKSTTDEGMQKACQGLVWKLIQEPAFLNKVAKQQEEENDEEQVVETTEVVVGSDGKPQVVTTKKRASIFQGERVFQYDMMISYCHADKDIVYKIHQFLLDQGFKIWIDLNNMFGPAMSAMAEAVENSEFVIMCMSDSYKQSTYCQAEAEYAFNCKRRLLPLILRPNYKPDGWLGFMIGSRIYIDFGFFDFDTACDKLLNEISLQRKRPLPSKVAQAAKPAKIDEESPARSKQSSRAPSPPPPQIEKPPEIFQLSDIYTTRKIAYTFKTTPIDSWTESDVLDFLFDRRANELMPLCEKMDGRALKQLYKMSTSQSNETFNILNGELKSTQKINLPIGIYTRFLSIMEGLVKPPTPPPPPPELPPPQPIYYPVKEEQPLIDPLTAYSNLPYDLIITSNAPSMELLQTVAHWVSRSEATRYTRR